tara:strand:+ start:511 stop:693 length:183 start_codon:yes stop_codon:yes gene_type:complete
MKISLTVGRKGAKYKVLYCGEDAGKAVAKMASEVDSEKVSFDEVAVFRKPFHFKRRKLMA